MDVVEQEEAEFTRQILERPDDVTTRLVFADWLDEHGRKVEAKYLRDIRKHKFIRLVGICGGWALKPQWAVDRGKRLDLDYTPKEECNGHSERWKYWDWRFRCGWKVPAHVVHYGYSMAVTWFGVYVWEYLDDLSNRMPYWNRDERAV